ncbi:MAG: signal peptide peptidase SppA [Desulfobacterales bacterium]|nr:signal peptide peptidase SppA [Desulfobacterales bacterium]
MGTVVVISILVAVAVSPDGPEEAAGIGVVKIEGVIARSDQVLKDLRYFRENDEIKAIVLRVESPGGGVGASQEIYRALLKTREVKPVVTSMGGVAASGGYYAAAATSGIVANTGTITGSIGVILGYTNFRRILDKIGLEPVVFKSGEMKDAGSPTREMTEVERKYLQHVVSSIHEQFVSDVAESRKLERDKVVKLADGRIYTGLEAKELGLVDRLGNMEDALEWAAELGGLDEVGEPQYPPRPKEKLVDYIMNSAKTRVSQVMSKHGAVSPSYLYQVPGV